MTPTVTIKFEGQCNDSDVGRPRCGILGRGQLFHKMASFGLNFASKHTERAPSLSRHDSPARSRVKDPAGRAAGVKILFTLFSPFKTAGRLSLVLSALHRMYKKRDVHKQPLFKFLSLSLPKRLFHIVTLSFSAHNSVWNSLWSIVKLRDWLSIWSI